MSIENETKTVEAMIRLYCRDKHGTETLCDACAALADYARERLARCQYGDAKPKCRNCETHCYAPAMRQQIAEVMRYAGPRMLLHHPLMGLQHALKRK